MKLLLWLGILSSFIAANTVFAQTWTPTSAPSTNWTSVASSADGTKLVAAANGNYPYLGQIFTSTDSGASWRRSGAPITNLTSLTSVASSADGTKLVAGAYEGIYISADSGATWTLTTNINTGPIASSADGTRLVGAYGYASTNSGLTWVLGACGGQHIASSADGTKLVVAWFAHNVFPTGGVFISTNAGMTWAQTSAPVDGWTAVASSADGTVLAATRGDTAFPTGPGPIYLSTNSGAAWMATSAPSLDWRSIACSADGTKWVATANFGGVYTSADSGATWSNSAPTAPWSSVASSADGSKSVAAINGGGIYTLQRTPTPSLAITSSGGSALLSWTIPSLNFGLQQNSDLTTTNWTDVPTLPILNLTNLQNQVTVSPTNGHSFYRLKH